MAIGGGVGLKQVASRREATLCIKIRLVVTVHRDIFPKMMFPSEEVEKYFYPRKYNVGVSPPLSWLMERLGASSVCFHGTACPVLFHEDLSR